MEDGCRAGEQHRGNDWGVRTSSWWNDYRLPWRSIKEKNKTCRNCEIKYSKEILLLQVLDAFFNVLATLRQCISRWDLEYSWYLSKNAFTFLFSWSKGFNSKWPIVPALARPSGGRHWSWSGPDPWHGRSLPRQPSGRSRQVFKTLHTFLWSEGVLEESRTELKSWHRLNPPPAPPHSFNLIIFV